MKKIALLCTTFNSLTQAVYVRLKDMGFKINVIYSVDLHLLYELNPDLILAPYLKSYIPKEIYEKYMIFVFHPGPIGDRGAYSLEHAIEHKKWGGVWLKADEKLDGGDIYASCEFEVKEGSKKSSIYRDEIRECAVTTLDDLLNNIKNNHSTPQLDTPLHTPFTQERRKIDWNKDSTSKIIKKIKQADSYPGVLDEILGLKVYIFGAWREDKLKGEPKQILAKRDGAICIGTIDGAIWISHLKEPNRFKLPSTYVLKDRLKGVKEDRLALLFDRSYNTFFELYFEQKDEISYLYFNFHNGAFSSAQCIRLKYAFEYLKESSKVVVLMGGDEFFSNGIHLNILEDSKKVGEDGWENINAMNDLIQSIIFADDVLTVASVHKNAGAGGVFLALACDFVLSCEGVVFNPHYKSLGLSGSEYHSFLLPKRVGDEKASELLEKCLPISAKRAFEIGMLDKVIKKENYFKELESYVETLYSDEFLWDKEDYLESNKEMIEELKQKELEQIHPEFWKSDSSFHTLRREFVYKICPTHTPKRLLDA